VQCAETNVVAGLEMCKALISKNTAELRVAVLLLNIGLTSTDVNRAESQGKGHKDRDRVVERIPEIIIKNTV